MIPKWKLERLGALEYLVVSAMPSSLEVIQISSESVRPMGNTPIPALQSSISGF